MNVDFQSVIEPFFLSWNLRNLIDSPLPTKSKKFMLRHTQKGEYPIDAWEPCFLEVPKKGTKKDITGRMSSVASSGINKTIWNHRRIINLPTYINSENVDMEILKQIVRNWKDFHISDDIPCLALAIKCHGNYSDAREAQYSTILLIWHDFVCRILTLDFFEGPLEDCITPEWYIKTAPLLNIKEAIERLKELHNDNNLQNPVFSIFTLPSCLGCELNGKVYENAHKQWGHEWKYNNHTELTDDLDQLFSNIINIFSNEKRSLNAK